MKSPETIGIIDIGSNTVRLVVFRSTVGGAFRLIDQARWSARLGHRLTSDGRLDDEAVQSLIEMLSHFVSICRKYEASAIRCVATAAMRAARNRDEVLTKLHAATGIAIEILTGEQEARYGGIAVMRSLPVTDGYVVDIGGGSTEISLIRDRRIVQAVSYPVGCVNVLENHGADMATGPVAAIERVHREVRRLLSASPWTSAYPGLPLIGLGGTVRAFAKVIQRSSDYPLPRLHGFEQSPESLEALLERLASMTTGERRKMPGLSKDRSDVIVPGLAILSGVMRHLRANKLVVSGNGIREGLLFETGMPDIPNDGSNPVLEHSIRNLNALYPSAPPDHLEQVSRLALALFDGLDGANRCSRDARAWLGAAAKLYKIGATIDWNEYGNHTFYMLLHTHWNGFSHREIVLTAAIASYKNANANRRKLAPYRTILREGDIEAAAKTGAVLQLAAALDRSESQAIRDLHLTLTGNELLLHADADLPLNMERVETESIAKDFKQAWGLTPRLLPQ